MVLISQGSKSKVPEKRAPAKKLEQKGLKKVQTSTAEQEQTPGFGGARFNVLKDSSLKFNQHDHIAPLNSRKNVHASLTKGFMLCSPRQRAKLDQSSRLQSSSRSEAIGEHWKTQEWRFLSAKMKMEGRISPKIFCLHGDKVFQ